MFLVDVFFCHVPALQSHTCNIWPSVSYHLPNCSLRSAIAKAEYEAAEFMT